MAFVVAPLVGAWIEIPFLHLLEFMLMSLPLWERGLKSKLQTGIRQVDRSLPLWERGLKSNRDYYMEKYCMSLPLWERGLKFSRLPDCMKE